MTITVTIYLEKEENVLTVPRKNAIKREQGKTVVTVLDNNDKMNQRTVVATVSKGYVEILDGVSEGEKVII